MRRALAKEKVRKEVLNLPVLGRGGFFGRVSVQVLWQAVKLVFKLVEDSRTSVSSEAVRALVGSGYSMKANLASDSVSRLIEGLLISRTWFIRAVAR